MLKPSPGHKAVGYLVCESGSGSLSITSNSLQPHGLHSSWNSPGQNTFPSPGDFPNSETEPRFPALQVDSLPAEPPGKPDLSVGGHFYSLFLTLTPLVGEQLWELTDTQESEICEVLQCLAGPAD